jgi:tetratricopeptide (TPR) repeat protein
MKYRAFISYSSKDRLIGERFHRALERYKIPKPLRGRRTTVGEVPKRLTPIFRDRSDLEASTDLALRIRSGLESSQSLIPLCSPFSAASKWVNQEIVTFKRLGRTEHIIPVLVSGDPIEYHPAAAPNGAFPPALMREPDELDPDGGLTERRTPEPFAPDLREVHGDGSGGDGFELAKLKVIARLIDVPLAELTQRQAEVERRDRRIITAVALVMLLFALAATAGGWFAWNKNLEAQARLGDAIDMAARQVDAAASYRDRYGVPGRVLQELLDSAQRDFSDLINDVGETPQIQLQRARLALRFADLYDVIGDFTGRSKMLAAADKDLEALETRTDEATLTVIKTILQKLGLTATVSRHIIARERLRYWHERAADAILAKQYPAALKAARNAAEIAGRQAEADASDTTWKRDLARTHLLTADVYYRAGDLSASKSVYQSTIPELIASGDIPSRADLLTAYSNLATTVVELDERQEAFGYQERAVATAREILRSDSDKTDAKRTLAVALTRLGDMALAANMNPEDALRSYFEARAAFEDLVGVDPLRVDWHRDRYVFLERISSAHLQLGRLEAANADLTDAIKTIERLLRIDPKNLDWRRDETVLYERLGQIRLTQSQQARHANTQQQYLSEAIAALEHSVAGRQELLRQTPEDMIAKHDLSMALSLLATAQSFRPKQLPKALEIFDRALTIMAELAARPGAPPNWRREIADIHVNRGRAYDRAGRFSEARSEFTAALTIIRCLRRELPNVRQYDADELDLVRLLTGFKP